MADQNKLKAMRYNERTSIVGKTLGQVTGPAIGLSPKQIDHLITGYTGTLGAYVLSLASLIADAGSDASKPALTAGDIPLIKVLYKGDRVAPNRYREDFYELLKQAQQIQLTANALRKEGRTDAAQKLITDNQDILWRRKALMNANRQLTANRERIKALYRDTSMSASDKRAELNRLQRIGNDIAERAVRLERVVGSG